MRQPNDVWESEHICAPRKLRDHDFESDRQHDRGKKPVRRPITTTRGPQHDAQGKRLCDSENDQGRQHTRQFTLTNPAPAVPSCGEHAGSFSLGCRSQHARIPHQMGSGSRRGEQTGRAVDQGREAIEHLGYPIDLCGGFVGQRTQRVDQLTLKVDPSRAFVDQPRVFIDQRTL